ncbi:emp24/gp25L/p24 family/GOLD-domain-containing protein [Cladochytrium replicatum]|nr:emp24/gp25L/p24 family/GOLD-domain-containing protein [Cladochytrium replicatum]
MASTRRMSLSLLAILVLLALPLPSRALYFYLDRSEQKCFLEELPKDTTVVGIYKTEEWDPNTNSFKVNPGLGMQILVEELPDRKQLVKSKGAGEGRFTFTTSAAGDHQICLQTNSTVGWFSTSRAKVHLDMLFGEPSTDTTSAVKKEVLNDLAARIKDLTSRIAAIRREHKYQRDREESWRDTSERVNSRVLNWTLIQIVVLVLTCFWQLRHLKSFFIAKKLV